MTEFREADLAWLAGLLEGEGCFYLKMRPSPKGPDYPTMCIQLAMTDEDIVRRAMTLTGVGKVRKATNTELRRDGEPCKDKWIWWVGRKDGCEELMRQLLPWMGQRRAAKITEILTTGEAHPMRLAWQHGTRQGYERGCRLSCCREIHNTRMCEQRARRSGQRAERASGLADEL